MWRHLVLIVAVLGATAAARAEEKSEPDPYVKVAIARAKAEIALRDSAALFDDNRCELNPAAQAVLHARDKMNEALNNLRGAEAGKEEFQRDEKFVAACDRELTVLELKAARFEQVESKEINLSYNEARQAFGSAGELFNKLADAEKAWKESSLDLPALVAVYAALEKRVLELRGQAQKAVADVLDALSEPAGKEQEYEHQTGTCEDELILREGVAQYLDQTDAHEDTADRRQATDDGH